MIVDPQQLGQHEFALSDIEAAYRRPTYHTRLIRHRRRNGFLYLLKGECSLECDGTREHLTPGTLFYLPKGSRYSVEINTPDVSFYSVNFNLYIDGDFVLFSKTITRVCDTLGRKAADAFGSLARSCAKGNNLLKNEALCALLSALYPPPTPLSHAKLGAALQHLDEHFTEHIDCRKLAALCFLSTAQFYNLFRAQLGMTPLEYRDALLLRQAKSLLDADGMSVTEVAAHLGFSSVAYFSRFFKKHVGLSPSAFAEQSREL